MSKLQRFNSYGLEDYNLSLEALENISLEESLSRLDAACESLAVSIEDAGAMVLHQGINNAETAAAVTENQKSKFKQVMEKIISFFQKVFATIIEYISNISVIKERLIARDEKNLETLKTLTNKDNFGELPKTINVPAKLMSLTKTINTTEIHSVDEISHGLMDFYKVVSDANKIAIDKADKVITIHDKITKMQSFSQGQSGDSFLELIRKSLVIPDIKVGNNGKDFSIVYNEQGQRYENLYIVSENELDASEATLVLKDVSSIKTSIHSAIDLAKHSIDSEKSMLKSNKDLSKFLREMNQRIMITKLIETQFQNVADPIQKDFFVRLASNLRFLLAQCVELIKPVLKLNKRYSGAFSSFLNGFTKALV